MHRSTLTGMIKSLRNFLSSSSPRGSETLVKAEGTSMPTFAIADCPPRLALAPAEKNGKAVQTGAISLTVRNTSEQALAGRIQLRPQAGAKPSWFAIAGAAATSPIEIEQDFTGKGTRTITVTVTVDAGEPGGRYLFDIRATSEL